MSAVAAMLGERLHLQHGPIDLIVSAEGDAGDVRAAYAQARAGFGSVLQALVDELDVLRRDVRELRPHPNPPPEGMRNGEASWIGASPSEAAYLAETQRPHPGPPRTRGGDDHRRRSVSGPVARRMVMATSAHKTFITPMAAVAGSVADHVLAALHEGRALRRASVNNGGDIALWLSDGESYRIGVCTDPQTGEHGAQVSIRAEDGIGGVATSGWCGRSHSLGIADAVTVLARTAAEADAAATLIANAVDLPGSDKVSRERAEVLSPDSDLGSQLVTTGIASLTRGEILHAIGLGDGLAKTMIAKGLIASAFLSLQGEVSAHQGAGFARKISENSV